MLGGGCCRQVSSGPPRPDFCKTVLPTTPLIVQSNGLGPMVYITMLSGAQLTLPEALSTAQCCSMTPGLVMACSIVQNLKSVVRQQRGEAVPINTPISVQALSTLLRQLLNPCATFQPTPQPPLFQYPNQCACGSTPCNCKTSKTSCSCSSDPCACGKPIPQMGDSGSGALVPSCGTCAGTCTCAQPIPRVLLF